MPYPKLHSLDRSVICYLKAYFKNFMYINMYINIDLEIHFITVLDLILFALKTEYNIFFTFIITQQYFTLEWHARITFSFSKNLSIDIALRYFSINNPCQNRQHKRHFNP